MWSRGDYYINTLAWGSRCSFNLEGQCEKPQDVERATGRISTSFLYHSRKDTKLFYYR